MSLLDFGQHSLVDIESLIDYLYLFTGLLFIPLFKFRDDRLVDVVGPVVNLENLAAVLTAGAEHQHC